MTLGSSFRSTMASESERFPIGSLLPSCRERGSGAEEPLEVESRRHGEQTLLGHAADDRGPARAGFDECAQRGAALVDPTVEEQRARAREQDVLLLRHELVRSVDLASEHIEGSR